MAIVAAAQREDGATPIVSVGSHADRYILIRRIWFCTGKYNGLHTGSSQDFLNLPRHAALMEEAIGNNLGLMTTQALHQLAGISIFV